jgi:hypothetical protein
LKEFELDFFSHTTVELSKLPESESLVVQEFIKSFYPSIGKVISIYSFGSLDINSRNMKINTELGSFTLKFWESAPYKRLNEIIEILLFLHSEDIRIPIPIANNVGGYISGLQHEKVSVFHFVEGELYTPRQDNLGLFFEATGQLFSKLSKMSKVWNVSRPTIYLPIEIGNSIKQSLGDDRLWAELDAIDLQECLASLWPLINKDLDLFSRLNHVHQAQYSHFDLHPKNVVFDRDKGFGFLDFASCAISNPNIAWGFLLIKNLRQAVVNSDENDNVKLLVSRAASDLQKIDFAQNLDVVHLPIYGRYEIARRLAYILDEYTKLGGKTWLNMLPVQIRLLKESYLLFGEE